MSNSLILALVIVIFFVIPPVFLFLTVRDIILSRRKKYDLDSIAKELKPILDTFDNDDLSYFDAELSNWLEIKIQSVKTNFSRGFLRLLMHAKYIGLGEGHREKLENDSHYRKLVIDSANNIVNSLECKDSYELMHSLGYLFGIFMQNGKEKGKNIKANYMQHREITVRTLRKIAAHLNQDMFYCEELLREEMKNVNSSMDIENDKEISLLILQWATIKIKQKEKRQRKANYDLFRRKNFRDQLLIVADFFENQNMANLFDLLTKSL